MRGIVHEPQVNIGADQKFSPVDVFKQEKKRGYKPWNFNRWIKRQTAPLSSLQNGQVTKSNKTYTLREFPERFAKDRIRLHELSPFSKGQSIYVFQKKLNQNHKIWKECHEHCTNFPLHCIVSYGSALPNFTTRLHASASLTIMLIA